MSGERDDNSFARGARVEAFDAPVRSSSLYNEDLAPIPAARRSWGTYNYAALWIAMSVNIPTYMLASGMIAGGMNWKQAIFTVFLGNVLVLDPDAAQRACGREIRNSLPGLRARRRSECWARTFRPFCARWWPAAGSAFRPGSAAKRSTRWWWRSFPRGKAYRGACRLLPVFLAAARDRDRARHPDDPLSAGRDRAVSAADRRGAAALGRSEGGRIRADACRAVEIPELSANSFSFSFRR